MEIREKFDDIVGKEFEIDFVGSSSFSPCAPSLSEVEAVFDNADYDDLWESTRPADAGPTNQLVFLESASYSGDMTLDPSGPTAPSPNPSPGDTSKLPCFSGSVVVQVKGKGNVLMRDLQVGDQVLTKTNTHYQPIYAFGHHEEDAAAVFYRIHTKDQGEPLEMTGNHLIFVYKKDRQVAIPVEHLRFGDLLIKDNGKTVPVDKITSTAPKTGLYMPLTADGTIAVNGIVASTYVSIQWEAPKGVADAAAFFFVKGETLLHWWMSPYRILCGGALPSSSFCSDWTPSKEKPGILPWLLVGQNLATFLESQHSWLVGQNLATFLESQHSWLRVVLFGIPAYLLFAVLNFLEWLLLGSPFALAGLISLCVCYVSHRSFLLRVNKSPKRE